MKKKSRRLKMKKKEVIDKDLAELLCLREHSEVVGKVFHKNNTAGLKVVKRKHFAIAFPKGMKEGELYPCIVSHTDTVSQNKPKAKDLILEQGVLTNPKGVLGADDRAGCWIQHKMLEAEVKAIYILTDLEEVGGIGADACAKSTVFKTITPFISAFIELDRESNKDIALYGYDNEDLVALFEKHDYKPDDGSYTDIVDLSKASGIASINLSIGYYNQHTKREKLVISELENTTDIMCNFMPKELYTTQYAEDGYLLGGYGYGCGMTLKWETVSCDICGEHALLYDWDSCSICAICAQDIEYGFYYQGNSTLDNGRDDTTNKELLKEF